MYEGFIAGVEPQTQTLDSMVWGFGAWAWGLGFRVQGLGLGCRGLGFRLRVSGLGFARFLSWVSQKVWLVS